MKAPFALEALGESAVLLRLGNTLDPELNQRVHALAAHIRQRAPVWLLDIVPAFASLALCVDPLAFPDEVDPTQAVCRWLEGLGLDAIRGEPARAARQHVVPVCYGGDYGPDLDSVAAHAGLDPSEVIRRHVASTYRVGMLGFAAGFPYLLGMDASLAMPRRATPRTRVAAGSVGIGGLQTGIYPRHGPGGWQIIGQTAFGLFDPGRDPPAAIGPGDCIRFVQITPNERIRQ